MLVTPSRSAAERARKLSTQAREPAPHYEHREIGYNYRVSNVLAGIGIGQLRKLEEKVAARRRNFEFYFDTIGTLPGLELMPEAEYGRHTRWLSVCTIEPSAFGADTTAVRLALEAKNIEARPVWKPMHLQPVFSAYPITGGAVSEDLFHRGLCLPSGSSMTTDMLSRVATVVREQCDSIRPVQAVAR